MADPARHDARQAAGRIHCDIERGFIRAEVIAYDDFMALGSEAKCREAGKLRLEGKEYVVATATSYHSASRSDAVPSSDRYTVSHPGATEKGAQRAAEVDRSPSA